MWEFTFYSRGGQGAVTAAKILVNASILDGKFAQAIPSYGQERKGAPVYAYARINESAIDLKSYVYTPNCIVVFDTSLPDLGIDIFAGVVPGAVLIANTSDPNSIPKHPNVSKIATLDADAITRETIGDVPPNVAMLGMLARATGCISLEALLKAIESKIPGKAGVSNAEACRRAYEETRIHENA